MEQAYLNGYLPGDAEDDNFFTEEKMKEYFQKVVEREIEDARKMGGAIAGLSEGGVTNEKRNQEPD